jgi:hypothetical protein
MKGATQMARTSATKKRAKEKIEELEKLTTLLCCQFEWARERDIELNDMMVELVFRLTAEKNKLTKGE